MIQFPYNKYNGHLKSAGRFIIDRGQPNIININKLN